MPKHIVLLRAVNVGGRWVKMARLREFLLDNDFQDVETHIQSGNVLVGTPMRSTAKVSATLEALLQEEFGFAIPCIVRSPAQLRAIADFAETQPDPLDGGTLRRYVTFYRDPLPQDRADELAAWDEPGERLLPHGSEMHWWLAKPAHEAKISNARLERGGAVSTTRDLTVVRALAGKWG
ncbi:DUF1697 domain-containing protein [Flexivirga caeni]|uniref:DUF1697 domain-containing protein n=1 Tax=Flexivirga caeni TaxID=2294115 RepID=A0A3M9MB49_9MICO|nr:DUF1697 domain-containing protein [Flexivirga caeni]RNI22792.1 DUF1697 domain-containing protein [Flexivirga caeni]